MNYRQNRRRRHFASHLAIVEVLEPRQMLSISGSDFLGPTTIGRTLTYSVSNGIISGTVTDTYRQGAGGTIEVDSTNSVSPVNGSVASGSETYRLNGGAVQEVSSISIVTDANGTQTQNYADTYSPAMTTLPATLTAGVPFTETVTDSTLDNLHGGVPDTSQNTNTLTLQSDTTQAITVPAGTFQCYVVVDSGTDTQPDGTATAQVPVTFYIAPGVGIVKTVETSSDGTITSELVSTSGGGGNTTNGGNGTLSATLTGNTLATSELSGADLKGKISLAVVEIGAAASKASGTVSVYASTTGAITSSSVLVGSSNVSVKGSATAKATITPKNVSLPAGAYTLIVRATDSDGHNTDTVTSSTLNVSAAIANFSTSTVKNSPAFATLGKPVTVTVLLINTGNAPTTGATTVSVALTGNGTTPLGAALQTISVKAGVKTNKPTKAALKFTLPLTALDTVASVSTLITITENGVTTTLVGPAFQFKAR